MIVDGQIVEEVQQVSRPTMVNNREVMWVQMGSRFFALYEEPLYRDKVVIDEKAVHWDMDFQPAARPGGRTTPVIKSVDTIPRDLLALSRALAAWDYSEPITLDSIQDMLPLKVASFLLERLNENAEWRDLIGAVVDDEGEAGMAEMG